MGTGLRQAALITLCIALATVACSSGGSSSSPTRPGMITFTPEVAPAPGSIFLAAAPDSTSSSLVLELRAEGVVDLASVAFDLTVPSNVVRFTGFEGGDFLGTGVEYSAQGISVIQGLVLSPHQQGGQRRETDGSGVIMRLRFAPEGNGSGELRFSLSAANNSNMVNGHYESLGLGDFGGGRVDVVL